MASIRKRGNSYQITVSNGYDINGTKITETETWTPEPGMKKREIEVALNGFVADFERQVKSGKNVRGARLALKDLAKYYLKDMAPPVLARTTYKDYSDRVYNRILPAMGHMKIGNIRAKDVNDYKKMVRETCRTKRGKPFAEKTIQKDAAIISAMLSYAVSEGYLDMNMLIYSGRVSGHRPPQIETTVKYFTMPQLIRFIDALERPIQVVHREHKTTVRGKKYPVVPYIQTISVPNKWKLYFYIALFAGDRRGENISLTWEDLDMDTKEVNLDTSTDYVDGTMEQKSTKTHNKRGVTLPAYVIEVAKAWKAEQMQQALKLGDRWLGYHGKEYDKNFMFTQKYGNQMHICSPYTKFKRIIRMYNEYVIDDEIDRIPDDVPPHGLRHSAAAILISNNLDARTVAGILGHKDPTTTLNIYSYFFKNKGKEAADIMESKLLKNQKSS